MNKLIFQGLRLAVVTAGFLSALTACSGMLPSNDVGVSVSGVNYSGQEINGYLFFNPDNPKEIAGGEGLDPFGGGGIMCCYSLPNKWHPGLKVGLIVDNLHGDGKRTQTVVEIPPYPDEKVGDLWAIIYPDETVGAVSTNFGPGNEKWPGKIKGWPKPSVEYRRKLWKRELEERKESVRLFSEPTKNTPESLKREWTFYSTLTDQTKQDLKQFSGPGDPNFFLYLEKDRKLMLDRAKSDVEYLERSKP